MLKFFTRCLAACAVMALPGLVGAPAGFAQTAATRPAGLPAPPVPTTPPERSVIAFEDGGADHEQWERFLDQTTVRNVSAAGLYPIVPDAAKANGKAIIVVPGGGYLFTAMENEGFPVAERLASEGYSAFVLKYRTVETPPEPKAFLQMVAARFQVIGREPLQPFAPAVEDLSFAIDYVAENCAAYSCSGEDIGLIGFSAGGQSVLEMIANLPDQTPIGNAALLYPPMTNIPEGSRFPPVFLAIAADDPLFLQGGFALPEAFSDTADQFEFHLYGAGGHGFGTLRKGSTSEAWFDQYLRWLDYLPSSN